MFQKLLKIYFTRRINNMALHKDLNTTPLPFLILVEKKQFADEHNYSTTLSPGELVIVLIILLDPL